MAPCAGRRVLVVGLDCVPPRLAFERYRPQMPNLSALIARGGHGPLRSTVPPITIPAWASMLSGLPPGSLGVYGFSRQQSGRYDTALVDATAITAPPVWTRLRDAGLSTASLCVPPAYPVRPWADITLGCFLTPDADHAHAHPPALASDLEARFGPFLPDVSDFRSDDRVRILQDIHDLTEQRDYARHIWARHTPDFMAMVDIGPDRFHHAFWHTLDPGHPAHDPADPLCDAGPRYYALLDRQLGALLSEVDLDTTSVLVVSDHGARALRGGVCLNEWLWQHGYLVLNAPPPRGVVTPLSACDVDWGRTRAWASGGYCGRIYFNRRGLRPQGMLDGAQCEALAATLRKALGELPTPASPRPHRILDTEQAYGADARGVPPDLTVFFGDLDLRAIGSLGHGAFTIPGDDRGHDGCNHDWDGIYVQAGAGVTARGALHDLHLLDVTPTILALFGLPQPEAMPGRPRCT